MIRYKIIILLFVCNLKLISCQCQVYTLIGEVQNNYKPFKSMGEILNGYKNGKWIDIGDSGIIYVEGYYMEGIPVSQWKINYPNGTIRKEILYDSLGNIIYWARYDQAKKKIIEIKPDSIIKVSTIKRISAAEEILYSNETTIYTSHSETPLEAFNTAKFAQSVYSNSINYGGIIDALADSVFQGECNLFYESGNLANTAIYSKGIQTSVSRYYYRKNVLNIEDVYINKTLIKTIKYDAAGNIIRIRAFYNPNPVSSNINSE